MATRKPKTKIEKSSTQIQKPQPVLMIPLRRCGSHALRLRLNMNSDFYSPYPLHIVDFMPLKPLYGSLMDDAKYFQLITDLVGLQAFSLVPWKVIFFEPSMIFERLKRKPENYPRSIHTVIWEMLFMAGEQLGARVVMDKSLDNVHYWRELLELFPEMVFINVVRDPRGQISSINRAIIHDFDTLLNLRTWVKAYQAAEELIAAHPEKVLTVRYEDFVADEAKVLKEISKFVKIDFTPQMLDISSSEEAQYISRLSDLWVFNSSKPIPAHVDKFKNTLSFNDIERIETLTGKYMDLYGYERMTEGKQEITEEMWDESRRQSDEAKQEAWETLRKNRPQDYIIRKRRANYIEMCRQNLLK